MLNSTLKNRLILIGASLALIVIWKIVSLVVGAEIILPSPETTFLNFIEVLKTKVFWSAVGSTAVRGLAGYLFSLCFGIIIGSIAGISKAAHSFIRPILSVIRSTPVVSIILIAIMWFKTDYVPVFVAFLMAFPIICGNVIEGIRNIDTKLLGMGRIYKLSRVDSVIHISLPSLVPYLIAAADNTLGLTWKVVITAEVLTLPLHAVGTGLQFAQLKIETAEVFAWTLVAVLLSAVSHLILSFVTSLIPWRRKHGD